jgi:hypothetical protein
LLLTALRTASQEDDGMDSPTLKPASNAPE